VSVDQYRAWIADYEASRAPVVGQCQKVCNAMRTAFPELELRGGWVRTPLGYDTHYWLLTRDGEIIDPTASQFPQLRPEDYEDAGSTEPMVLLRRFLVVEPG